MILGVRTAFGGQSVIRQPSRVTTNTHNTTTVSDHVSDVVVDTLVQTKEVSIRVILRVCPTIG